MTTVSRAATAKSFGLCPECNFPQIGPDFAENDDRAYRVFLKNDIIFRECAGCNFTASRDWWELYDVQCFKLFEINRRNNAPQHQPSKQGEKTMDEKTAAPKMKTCDTCQKVKPQDQYPRHGSGWAKTCKACKMPIRKASKPHQEPPTSLMPTIASAALTKLKRHYKITEEDYQAMIQFAKEYA